MSAQADRRSEFIHAPFTDSLWFALETLYASVYSSRVLLQPLCGTESRGSSACAWLEKTEGRISALLLFRQEGPVVRVLNEVVDLSAAVIRRFATAIFARYPQAHLIKLHAVVLQAEEGGLPMWSSAFSEDYVLDLPGDQHEWLSSLTRQSREKIRYHLRRSFRRQPGLAFTVTSGSSITEAEINEVLNLNRQRMQRKGKAFAMSAAEETALCEQMQQVGMLFALRVNGTICAGLLCSLTGRDLYMHVIAHDPAHDDLRPGLVCCCLAIRYAIELKFSRFHFLWGHYDYKRRLGGRARALYRILVPRNYGDLLMHPLHSARWVHDAVRDAARRWRRPAISRGGSC